MILLCFFIMMCSFATMETSKVTRFVKSFSIAVSIFSGGLNFEKGEVVLPMSSDIVEADNPLANIFDEISEIMKYYGVDEDVGLFATPGGLTIRLSDTVLFESGRADISKSATPILKKISDIVANTSYTIRIEGHTDNLPINTDLFPSNWELSTTRAIRVLRYMVERQGISPSRLSAEGFGEYKPLVANDTAGNRAKNRRVEIKITGGNSKRTVMEIKG